MEIKIYLLSFVSLLLIGTATADLRGVSFDSLTDISVSTSFNGTGTKDYIPIWASSNGLSDSLISQNGVDYVNNFKSGGITVYDEITDIGVSVYSTLYLITYNMLSACTSDGTSADVCIGAIGQDSVGTIKENVLGKARIYGSKIQFLNNTGSLYSEILENGFYTGRVNLTTSQCPASSYATKVQENGTLLCGAVTAPPFTNVAYTNQTNTFTQVQIIPAAGIQTVDGNTILTSTDNIWNGANDGGLILNASRSWSTNATMCMVTEVSGRIATMGINVPQCGRRDQGVIGGIFRLDVRSGTESQGFVLYRYAANTNNAENMMWLNFVNGNIFFNQYNGNMSLGWATSRPPTQRLDINGSITATLNINVSGNITGNEIYGEMWSHNDAGYIIDLVTSAVYVKIHNQTSTYNNGFSFNTNSTLVTSLEGKYKIDYSITLGGTATAEFGTAILINGLAQNKTHAHIQIATANAEENIGGTGIISLNKFDNVSIGIRDEAGSVNDPTILATNFNLVRLGT